MSMPPQPSFRIGLALALMLLTSVAASHLHAELERFEVDVQGRGASEGAAVREGLIRAIEQINGVYVTSNKALEQQYRASMREIDGKLRELISDVEKLRQQVTTSTEGMVEGYDLTSTVRDGADWVVTMTVRVNRYTVGDRKTIAVLPMRIPAREAERFETIDQLQLAARQLARDMETRIVQTRRFAVLDRSHLADVLGEQRLIASGLMPARELQRVGQMVGADYLIVGDIEQLSLIRTPDQVDLTGHRFDWVEARGGVSFRVINTATAQIMWAGKAQFTLDRQPEWRLLRENEGFRASGAADVEAWMMQDLARQVADAVVGVVFPIRVVQVSRRGTITLNRGGDSLKEGDRLTIYAVGEKLIDPQTGEALGEAEEWLGVMEIQTVQPKFSTGRMVEGDPDDVQRGDVARPLAAASG